MTNGIVLDNIIIMKPRAVKTKIKQLVKVFGDRKQLAKAINIELSYVYKLESGLIPGYHLYEKICYLYESHK